MDDLKLTPREWARIKNLSARKLAEMLEVHENTMNRWLNHPSEMTVGNAMKLAEIFEISIDKFIFLP